MASHTKSKAGIDLGDELLSERTLAARWSKSPRTLQRWRAEDYGPAYIRLGGRVLYRLVDVIAYEDQNRWPGGTPRTEAS